MTEAISNDDQLSRTYRNIDTVLAVKRERLRKGNTVPDTIKYEGHVLDTDKLIEGLLNVNLRKFEELCGEA